MKSPRPKALLDTNVLISSFLTDGLSREIMLKARKGNFTAIVSPFILDEFREKLEKKFQINPSDVEEAVELINAVCRVAQENEIQLSEEIYVRDESDINVLRCAVAEKVNFLITGDKDLLEIKIIGEMKILSPREFVIFLESLS